MIRQEGNRFVEVREEQEPATHPAPPDDGSWKGLGDVIAAATTAVGIKPCQRCKRNQQRLNEAFPFK